jgi:hypothetical protein
MAIGEGGIVAGVIIGVPIAVGLWLWTHWRDRRNVPKGQRRTELMAALERMADRGDSYKQRFAYLRAEGLRANVAEGLIADVQRKEPADVRSPKTAFRGRLSFQYPGNWRLQNLDKGMDPETNFSVEALSSAMCIFTVRSPGSPALVDVDTLAEKQRANVKGVIEGGFDRYGSLSGQGIVIRGTVLNALPVEIRVFRCETADGAALAIVRSCMDEDLEDAMSGFELIEQTLEFQAGQPASGQCREV